MPERKKRSDILRWIDTCVTAADCSTKQMSPGLLQKIIDDNFWNFEQTEEAKAMKARKQAQRSNKGRNTTNVSD